MPEAEVLKAEMRNFRSRISPALHASDSHREGEHDDLLLALACAVWAAEHSAYATTGASGSVL